MTDLSKKLIRLVVDELHDEKKGAPTIQDVITELMVPHTMHIKRMTVTCTIVPERISPDGIRPYTCPAKLPASSCG